jgi:hypothetical protein
MSVRRIYWSMFGVTTSDDYRPVAWMGRYPVDVTTMLVGLHVALAIITCILVAAGAGSVLDYLQFDSARVLYVGLYAALLIAPAAVLTAWGFWQRSAFAGSPALHFGIFVAFATIYPRVELFLRITAKWFALILAAIYTLQLLAYHAWADLAVVWTSMAVAFLFVEWRGAGPELVWLSNLKSRLQPRPKFHVVQKTSARRVVEPDDVYASVDPILDKISRSGIGSLTANERRQLDRARNRLLKESQ